MSPNEARKLLEQVKYPSWTFQIVEHGEGEFSLQGLFTSPNDGFFCKTRKWRLSQYMTSSEVVQTAFKAVVTSAEHQAREFFTYCGRAVYGPHLDVDALWKIAGDLDEREQVMEPALRGGTP